MENLTKIQEIKNINNKGEVKMENKIVVTQNIKKEKKNMKYIIEYHPLILTTKNSIPELKKIKYAIIFKYKFEVIDILNFKSGKVYYPEIIPIQDILNNISDPKLSINVKEENESWLREFLNELPKEDDIFRKEVLKEIYETANYAVKILKNTIDTTYNDRYYVRTDNGVRNVTKGELISYAILKAYRYFNSNTTKIFIPTLGLGPEKVVYFHNIDKIVEIIKQRDLFDEFSKLGVPQKVFQRLHKFLSPLTKLPTAEVYIGDTDNILSIPKYRKSEKKSMTEGVLLVSKTYATKAGIVEGAKFSYTLKSLTHIVDDVILFIDGKQYDVALSMDENKWKVEASKLGQILHLFTGKTPDVNARLFKIVEFKANNMFFTRMENNLRAETIENLQTIQKILKNQSELEKILTKDKKSFKARYEKFLFEILSIDTFNKEEETEYDGLEREIHPVLNELGMQILNKQYINDILYRENGKEYHTNSTWFIPGQKTPELNNKIFPKLGKSMAKLFMKDVIYARFAGCSGTVLPLSMKAADAYPVASRVTDIDKVMYNTHMDMYEKLNLIEYMKERNAKMEELGIGLDMMYVQRHPSMLGVWTKLYYSPTTKLFYVDEELWNIYFGGDYDGDNFVALYPYNHINEELNNLNGKIIDPIDNPRMTVLIDNPTIRTFLLDELFQEINALRARFISNNKINEDIKTIKTISEKINNMNPNYKNKNKKYKPFFIKKEYQDWADTLDAQERVGKIHSIVCNALTFFVKFLDVKQELKFSTYFIYFYIQPAIEGLKHDEEGRIPDLKELLIEMCFVFKEMFGNDKFTKLHLPTIQDIKDHKLIYAKVRNFATIGLLNKNKDEYIYDDLFYKRNEYMEIAKRINTPWTGKYKKLIKLADKYFPLPNNNKPTPTPNKKDINETKNMKAEITAIHSIKETDNNDKINAKIQQIMKEHIDLVKHNKWDENDIKNRILDIEDNLMSDKDIDEMLMNEYEELRKEEVMAEMLPLTLEAVKEEFNEYDVSVIRKPTKDGYGKERWGEYKDLSPRIKRYFFTDSIYSMKWDEVEGILQQHKGDNFDLFEYLRIIDMKIPVGINKKQKKEKKMKNEQLVLPGVTEVINKQEEKVMKHNNNMQIYSLSRREDIPAFKMDKAVKSIKEGKYVDCTKTYNIDKNGFFVWWTKNPVGFLKHFNFLHTIKWYCMMTITGYEKDMEMNLPSLDERIETYIKIAKEFPSQMIWRYDPIILNNKYNEEWHKNNFKYILSKIGKLTPKIIISIVDNYGKVQPVADKLGFSNDISRYQKLATELAIMAKNIGIPIESCGESVNIPGIQHGGCVNIEYINKLAGTDIKYKKDPTQRAACKCHESISIGSYNQCKNGCVYCYANPTIDLNKLKVSKPISKEEPKMKTHYSVFISGSSTVKVLPKEAVEMIKKLKSKNTNIIIGDCYGVDTLVQKELNGYKNVNIYSMYANPRNNIGNWEVKTIKNNYTQKVDYPTWQQQKDVAMTNACTHAIAIWDGQSRGTKANIDRIKALGKKLLIINTNNPTTPTTPTTNKPIEKSTKNNQQESYEIYTDGSYSSSTKIGSWAFIVLKNGIKIHEEIGKVKENLLSSRNVSGECVAVLKALQYCDANKINDIEIYHDYKGIQLWIEASDTEKAWEPKTDIAKIYNTWFNKLTKNIKYKFNKVKGHSGNKWNEEVDKLAKTISEAK